MKIIHTDHIIKITDEEGHIEYVDCAENKTQLVCSIKEHYENTKRSN